MGAVASTPLEVAPDSLAPGRRLLLKREDLHEIGAFKWRGGLPTLEACRPSGGGAVVTASTGNHCATLADGLAVLSSTMMHPCTDP